MTMSEGADAPGNGLGHNAACPVPNCSIPVDLILRSSDQELIGAHKANLEHFSDGFPSADTVSDSKEPVDLSENGTTLKLLLSGMHKQKLPTLSGLGSDQLLALAEAGEKYFVYGVMAACSEHVRAESRLVKDGRTATAYFAYAAKFGYVDVADAVAPFMVDLDTTYMKSRLIGYDTAFLAWMRYREQFVALSDALTSIPAYVYVATPMDGCTAWANYVAAMRVTLPMTVKGHLKLLRGATFDRLEGIFDAHYGMLTQTCRCRSGACCAMAGAWKAELRKDLLATKPFSSFL
ncbi:hypothetical protein DFP72DRAFT_642047 [Ephemerocybe angulata]|uniref:BTB domain-containing protein n=1 Tax=Ephemerocybe angulata TaxID=980116 RepID=A0A8H6LX04_9AGAR|nr:hypothetical protein DFP72DRAFT_642047 [Tulosesus angulatus]